MDDDFDALKRDATAWIVRITSGSATTGDADALVAWRARSPDHERAFQEAARLWRDLGPALSRERRSSVTRRSFLALGGVAAGLAGGAVVMSELGFLPTLSSMLADYATAVGEQQTVHLPDGSMALLDGGSVLSLDYSAGTRQLQLSAGAAVFEVSGDDPRPFVVEAGGGRSKTVSASLSVTHGADSVAVECLRGEVSIDCLGTADLAEGEAISYSQHGLGEKVAADIETAAAWRKGLLIFKDRSLGDVISDINRHRRGKVMLARRSVGSYRVSGIFHLERPEEILAHIEDTLKLRPVGLIGGIILLV